MVGCWEDGRRQKPKIEVVVESHPNLATNARLGWGTRHPDGVAPASCRHVCCAKTAGEMCAVKPARRRRYLPERNVTRGYLFFPDATRSVVGKITRSIRLWNPTLTSQSARG